MKLRTGSVAEIQTEALCGVPLDAPTSPPVRARPARLGGRVRPAQRRASMFGNLALRLRSHGRAIVKALLRSEEHTSELQSPYDLVCRLLLEKKKYTKRTY